MSPACKTISAISTPPGKGGVAVIRISGEDSRAICRRIFCPAGKVYPIDAPRKQIYGNIMHDSEPIDDGLACFFPAPNSYTGEDTVEISCHGGILITHLVLEASFAAGASPAEPGEFTRRAFVNGRLTLSEADAIGLLLDAKSEAQLKLARSEARQKLNQKIQLMRDKITSLLGSIYARIDYPDEDLGEFTNEDCLQELYELRALLSALISTYKTGRAVRDGIRTAIVGKPNSGKSSFYNLLAGEDLAIVTDIPGTTRDVLERSVSLGSVMLNLADTAGIRQLSSDPIEAIGIRRSIERLEDSELIFALFDGSIPLSEEDMDLIQRLKSTSAAKVAILTKADLCTEQIIKNNEVTLSELMGKTVSISALNDGEEAIHTITEIVDSLFTDEKIKLGTDAVIASASQHASLLRAMEHIEAAIGAFESGLPQDVSSSDVELALEAISEVDGRAASQAVVADIFSKFCVGK